MPLHRIPCAYYRGGTSKALMFRAADLPADRKAWDAIFLGAMGVPDPAGRNLDGMGGGLSSLNKVCVVGPPSRSDADVDYTFAQCAVKEAKVEYGGNCGNMSAAVGPFAVEEGLVASPADGEAVVRIHNTNTGKIIVARFPVEQGALASAGDLAIDGVAGTAAPIRLEFLAPGGAKTGRLLPTGNPVDIVEGVEASCIDAANPCVFVMAEALGKTGGETPQELEADTSFVARMAAIREAGAQLMGIPGSASVPLVAMVSSPNPPRNGEGDHPQDGGGAPSAGYDLSKFDEPACTPPPPPSAAVPLPVPGRIADIQVRMISMGQPHRATPITGAICLAIASRTPGTLPHRLCAAKEGPIRIAHPSGVTMVDAALNALGEAEYGAVFRTARRLFEGNVLYRS
jgi:2-methylaconitate cis-trans-isomerase PrpF